MRRWLPELIALPLLPLLLLQGRRTRRMTPRLPEAVGPTVGQTQMPVESDSAASHRTLHVLVIGESPVAGVGVATHYEAITGQFATALAVRLGRLVMWQAVGKNGATLHTALSSMVPGIAPQKSDIVLIAFGVNDTSAFRSCRRYRAELLQLMQQVQLRFLPHLIVISGIPPIHVFPVLPQPLRYVLGKKAQALDEAVEQLMADIEHGVTKWDGAKVMRVPMLMDVTDETLMASDGYHPSVNGVAMWARQLATAVASQLKVGKRIATSHKSIHQQ